MDFYLSRRRDVNAAKAFLCKAVNGQRVPTKVTLDAHAASDRATADPKEDGKLPKRVRVRSSKYLNSLIEQDHRRIKQRLRTMLGLKSFQTAKVLIGGIELAEKSKKGKLKMGELGGPTATMPDIWPSLDLSVIVFHGYKVQDTVENPLWRSRISLDEVPEGARPAVAEQLRTLLAAGLRGSRQAACLPYAYGQTLYRHPPNARAPLRSEGSRSRREFRRTRHAHA